MRSSLGRFSRTRPWTARGISSWSTKMPALARVTSVTRFQPRAHRSQAPAYSTSVVPQARDDDDKTLDDDDDEDADEDESDDEEDKEEDMQNLTPRETVNELDRHIVGQSDAKRAVALALRNRWRRKKLDASIRDEVMPKNILMIGPTGVGKTEIARRLAKLVSAPFVKVEATKYTEIGFHGRDVDSIIRDLMEHALVMVRARRRQKLKKQIDRNVENRILDELLGKTQDKRSRKSIREHLRQGILDDNTISVDVPVKDHDLGNASNPMAVINLSNKIMASKRSDRRKMKISEARPIFEEMETDRLISTEDIRKEALESVQQEGIVFLDEIDKICSANDRHSADASAEGVQRDLLPLIEGSTINTKHGNIDTDHILFIASGAFHSVKPSDLLAELQGRLPVRVQLQPLKEADFRRILKEPENNLLKQQVMLMATEGIQVKFEESAVDALAQMAFTINNTVENIGARRLHTIIERVMEEISFSAADKTGSSYTITADMVRDKVDDLLKSADLKKFLL